jgi:Tfp pilus assembly protein PilN
MFKINLLPREVLERRRYEDWYPRVFVGGAIALVIVVAFYVLFMIDTNSRRGELQAIQEQTKQFSARAEELSIFQNKEEQLRQREDVAKTALTGRVNIGQVANDISLVLPDEVWLDGLVIDEKTGVVVRANTPRTAGQSDDVAYKSVAKTLVRLSELTDLYDVWLTTASNSVWGNWAASVDTSGVASTVNVVGFTASGKVFIPGGSRSSTATSGTNSVSGTSGQAGSPSAAAQGAAAGASSANPGGTQ